MTYKGMIKEAEFISRPNRFIAHAMLDGVSVTAHVKNTGRCRELLIHGARVLLEYAPHPNRKTEYSLIAVYKGGLLINIDSQAPNAAVKEALQTGLIQEFGKLTLIKPEAQYQKSRFDFYVETGDQKTYIEVKGVTLEEQGVVRFPDAPTERGTKHVFELMDAVHKGFGAAIIFVIQMDKAAWFEPNVKMDPQFAASLSLAKEKGVMILAYTCRVSSEGMSLFEKIEVRGF